jgi:pimeloyl-ACP methyl ester carboxylesterase
MHIVFLPGAGGASEFWHPLGALLPSEWEKTYLSWPGLGNQPHDPAVNGFDDLVALAAKKVRGPTVIVAQSMGGIIAVRLALKHPEQMTHLVLVATSGGVDVASLGGEDWRDSYFKNFPDAQTWIASEKPDLSSEIPGIACPLLLIWGDCDPISPLSVAKRLSELVAHARMHVVEGGDHDLGRERASDIAPLVIAHLSRQA